MAQQWWHGDIDGKQMQFGGILEGASGCDDLRPGEMESTLNLPCLTCFGRTCFGMVFLINFFFFFSRQDGVSLNQLLSSWMCAHDTLVASPSAREATSVS